MKYATSLNIRLLVKFKWCTKNEVYFRRVRVIFYSNKSDFNVFIEATLKAVKNLILKKLFLKRVYEKTQTIQETKKKQLIIDMKN